RCSVSFDLADIACPRDSRSLSGGVAICRAPGKCGIGGLDCSAKEHLVDVVFLALSVVLCARRAEEAEIGRFGESETRRNGARRLARNVLLAESGRRDSWNAQQRIGDHSSGGAFAGD